jgi:hypothetical protein
MEGRIWAVLGLVLAGLGVVAIFTDTAVLETLSGGEFHLIAVYAVAVVVTVLITAAILVPNLRSN